MQRRRFGVDVAVCAAVVCRDVSGNREDAVVTLIGRMATVLMGGERVSVVAAGLLATSGADPR